VRLNLVLFAITAALAIAGLVAAVLVFYSYTAHAAAASSGDQEIVRSVGVYAGGLVCFSITPPDTPTKPATPHAAALDRSCDALCAAQGAACTATTSNRNPPVSCAANDYDPKATLCRCCALDHGCAQRRGSVAGCGG
jgi:hypothetical protein